MAGMQDVIRYAVYLSEVNSLFYFFLSWCLFYLFLGGLKTLVLYYLCALVLVALVSVFRHFVLNGGK